MSRQIFLTAILAFRHKVINIDYAATLATAVEKRFSGYIPDGISDIVMCYQFYIKGKGDMLPIKVIIY